MGLQDSVAWVCATLAHRHYIIQCSLQTGKSTELKTSFALVSIRPFIEWNNLSQPDRQWKSWNGSVKLQEKKQRKKNALIFIIILYISMGISVSCQVSQWTRYCTSLGDPCIKTANTLYICTLHCCSYIACYSNLCSVQN